MTRYYHGGYSETDAGDEELAFFTGKEPPPRIISSRDRVDFADDAPPRLFEKKKRGYILNEDNNYKTEEKILPNLDALIAEVKHQISTNKTIQTFVLQDIKDCYKGQRWHTTFSHTTMSMKISSILKWLGLAFLHKKRSKILVEFIRDRFKEQIKQTEDEAARKEREKEVADPNEIDF